MYIRSLTSRLRPTHPPSSPLWLEVEFVLHPLPWNWHVLFYRHGRTVQLAIGPVAINVFDG